MAVTVASKIDRNPLIVRMESKSIKAGEGTQIDKGLKINGAVCGWKN